jgi:hypothetical protein
MIAGTFDKNKKFWEELIAYFPLMTRAGQKTKKFGETKTHSEVIL